MKGCTNIHEISENSSYPGLVRDNFIHDYKIYQSTLNTFLLLNSIHIPYKLSQRITNYSIQSILKKDKF